MVRGSGKFKTKRGGGRSFSRNLTQDENGIAVGTERRRYRKQQDEEDEDEDDEDEEDEEEDEDEEDEEGEEAGDTDILRSGAVQEEEPELTRAERRELKKKKKDQAKQKAGVSGGIEEEDEDKDEDDAEGDSISPEQVKKKLTISAPPERRELSRKEREAIEKKKAQERYWELHKKGQTEQAKSDLARLAEIRKQREAEAAKKKAETEAKAKEIEARKAAQKSGKRI